ncbi:MAG: NAD(P)/FAD-dependent oxidoreductase [Proteobacteria bacterium]|nr:NAD(P)/FAD-dependent oxidoreductase [Pseudomonadota bacterium]
MTNGPDAAYPPPAGTQRAIPRRDFLQGSLFAAATSLCGPLLCAPGRAAAAESEYYPPALTGLRGSHPGSFEAAHALRDGAATGTPLDTGESYDLVVVGAGISGLAAAHFYRGLHGAGRRILILDNHDDFGGHAKRNEFGSGERLRLVNGGTLDIDSPRPYGPVADGLLRDLGIDVRALARSIQQPRYYGSLGLTRGAFFDAETFGRDRLVAGIGTAPYRKVFSEAPLSERARGNLARIEEDRRDPMPGLSDAQKKARLARLSYRDYLHEVMGIDEEALRYCQALTHGEWGVGIDAVSALDLWGYGLPGFQGLKLSPATTPEMGETARGYHETGGSPHLHFPDGNATLARALVRRLVPAVAPPGDVARLVTQRFDYAQLDRPDSAVRVRLNSTVLHVVHDGAVDTAAEVVVSYQVRGELRSVRARHCVLACWNMVIPYLCPELPQAQKEALHSLVKTPLVYTNVALRNWQAFKALGVSEIYAPGSYFSNLYLNPKVDIGSYRTSAHPDEPTILRMERTPCRPGLSEHDQNRAGRAELLATPFATFETQIRRQLARTLGPGGFDEARDIEAITVNRWPHGYAPEFNSLFYPVVPEAQRPNVIGRARHGRITIANSDAAAAAYTDAAIEQGHRAVRELPA